MRCIAPAPVSLHWLGDREDADKTRHATDMRGCVMYFDRQSDCLEFMRWVGGLNSSSTPDTKAQHD